MKQYTITYKYLQDKNHISYKSKGGFAFSMETDFMNKKEVYDWLNKYHGKKCFCKEIRKYSKKYLEYRESSKCFETEEELTKMSKSKIVTKQFKDYKNR